MLSSWSRRWLSHDSSSCSHSKHTSGRTATLGRIGCKSHSISKTWRVGRLGPGLNQHCRQHISYAVVHGAADNADYGDSGTRSISDLEQSEPIIQSESNELSQMQQGTERSRKKPGSVKQIARELARKKPVNQENDIRLQVDQIRDAEAGSERHSNNAENPGKQRNSEGAEKSKCSKITPEMEKIARGILPAFSSANRSDEDKLYIQKLQEDARSAPEFVQRGIQIVLDDFLLYQNEGINAVLAQSGKQEQGDGDAGSLAQGASGRGDDETGPEEEKKAMEDYSPEIEVISDITDGILGMKLPPKAFYGQRALMLQTIGIQQAKEQAHKWSDICGLGFARLFIGSEPRLLCKDPEQLLRTLDNLSKGLGWDAEECVRFSLRNSYLMVNGVSLKEIRSTVEELCAVTGESEEFAIRWISRSSALLSLPEGAIRSRFEVMAAILPVDRQRLVTAYKRRPQWLTRSLRQVSMRMVQLSDLLQAPLSATAIMVAVVPGLTGVQTERARKRWELLQEAAVLNPAWMEQVRGWGPAPTARCLTVPERSFNRASFIIRHDLTGLPVAQDLKTLLTLNHVKFKTALLSSRPRGARSLEPSFFAELTQMDSDNAHGGGGDGGEAEVEAQAQAGRSSKSSRSSKGPRAEPAAPV